MIIWNKCQLKLSSQAQNQYLDYLIDPDFQWANSVIIWKIMHAKHVIKKLVYNCRGNRL